jgi:hypothetical protein
MRDGSRLVIGATTVALVGLATVGTSVLVDNGARTLDPGRSPVPPRTLSSAPPPGPLVVGRPAGSYEPPVRPLGPTALPRVAPVPVVALPPLTVVPVSQPEPPSGPAMLPRVLPGTPGPTPTPTPTPAPTETPDTHGKSHSPKPAHEHDEHGDHGHHDHGKHKGHTNKP